MKGYYLWWGLLIINTILIAVTLAVRFNDGFLRSELRDMCEDDPTLCGLQLESINDEVE